MRSNFKSQKGQALIFLLFFMVVAIIVTSAAVVMVYLNSLTTNKFEQGQLTYYVAESGAENAVLRLLRDPSYTGETLAVGDGSAVVQVTGGSSKIVTSSATLRNFRKKVEVRTNYNNGIFTIESWKEIY